ncbi:MAG: precorrin-3B synthase [Methylocapsa sp.]|nr:precorrin-3B synthase [Methylocapsa sp.]
MSEKALMRKGWCPGARRPMRAKDGLLVRIKISCGSLSAFALRGLAQAGRNHGNGRFDLTSRANLQVRGVREEELPHLIEALDVLGLVDTSARAEAVRNVLVSPLAGLDGQGHGLAAAAALEKMLAENEDLHALPAKFGFLIDDASALPLSCIPADVRFEWKAAREEYLIAIGGTTGNAIALGYCRTGQLAEFAANVARAFLRLSSQRSRPARRMRELIAYCGAEAIADASGLRLHPGDRESAMEDPRLFGLLRFRGNSAFGAGPPFGCCDSSALAAAVEGAQKFGTGEIRLTPWRSLVFPLRHMKQAHALGDLLAMHGFIVGAEDPRLAVWACAGSSACERATTDTRSDALALMPFARQVRNRGVTMQLFGCAKACGRKEGVPLTMFANSGLYDLAVGEGFFWRPVSGGSRLTLAAACHKLEALSRGAAAE